jgi:hypothetical protein
MKAYNLFRNRAGSALVCAVPEECSVPGFLTAPDWEFGGRVEPERRVPVGFDPRAAATGVYFNGFYLFEEFSRLPPMRDGPGA